MRKGRSEDKGRKQARRKGKGREETGGKEERDRAGAKRKEGRDGKGLSEEEREGQGASEQEGGSEGWRQVPLTRCFFFFSPPGTKPNQTNFVPGHPNRAGLCLYRESVPGSLGRAM